MLTFEEWRKTPKTYRRHCWTRLRRHKWEWHLGSQKLYAYARCVHCGWPGPMVRVEEK